MSSLQSRKLRFYFHFCNSGLVRRVVWGGKAASNTAMREPFHKYLKRCGRLEIGRHMRDAFKHSNIMQTALLRTVRVVKQSIRKFDNSKGRFRLTKAVIFPIPSWDKINGCWSIIGWFEMWSALTSILAHLLYGLQVHSLQAARISCQFPPGFPPTCANKNRIQCDRWY